MTRSVARFFSSSYQLRLSEYILLLELRYVTFFSHFCFFVFFLSPLPHSPLQLCPVNTVCTFTCFTLFCLQNTQKNLVKSQRTKIRIIRIEYELNSTNNWELNLTREPQRNWIRLFPLRRLWMLRPLRKRPAWPGKVLWSIGNLRPH